MDPIKPLEPTGSSSTNPQIKAPLFSQQPSSQQPGQQLGLGGQPPPNLPTKEEEIPAPSPAFPKPPQASSTPSPSPSSPSFRPMSSTPSAPLPSLTPSPVPAKSELPKAPPTANPPSQPAPLTAKPPIFKSSIRTMEEDIAAIKKGQQPVGVEIEKQSERDTRPQAQVMPSSPKITPPPKPAPEVKLGEPEKAKSLPDAKVLSATPPPPTPAASQVPVTTIPNLTVPPAHEFKKINLVFIAVGLVVAVFLIWFFALRRPSAPQVALSPTPTYTTTPTPTSYPIESYFSIVDSVRIQLGPNFTSRFASSINKAVLETSVGEPALYAVFNPVNGQKYTLSEFLAGLLISPPSTLISAVYDDIFYLTAIHKSDGKNGFGFVVRIKEPNAALGALGNWEKTMTQDMKDLLGFDPVKAASTAFLDNTYQGVAVRYMNFPGPSLTIDYAVVKAKDGDSYLIVTNSREHIYTIIDKLK